MKQLTKAALLLLATCLLMVGCRPEEEATDFGVYKGNLDIKIADMPLMDNVCSKAPDEDLSDAANVAACEEQKGCQAVYQDGSSKYLGCVPTPAEETRAGEEEQEEEQASGGSGTEEEEEKEEEEQTTGGSTGGEEAAGGSGSGSGGGEEEMEQEQEGGSGSAGSGSTDSGSTTSTTQVETEEVDPFAGFYCDKKVDDEDDSNNESLDENSAKKVLVCHTNNGAKKRKTICVSINGWLNGHQQGHAGHAEEDHLGACTEEELQ